MDLSHFESNVNAASFQFCQCFHIGGGETNAINLF